MTMGTWETRLLVKKGRGSQTTGKRQGIIASTLAKYMPTRKSQLQAPLYVLGDHG